MQSAVLDLGQMGDELCRELALRAHELRDVEELLFVGEVSKVHGFA
jgi:hypothetical protein